MTKIKKKAIAIIMLIALIVISTSGCTNGEVTQEEKNIVATVNGEEITYEDFNKNFKIVERSYNQWYGEKIWSQEIGGKTFLQLIKEQVLEKLITEELLTQKAKENDINIENENFDEMYGDFTEQLESNEELKQFYEENNINEEFIKNQMKMELYVERYKEQLFEELGLNDEIKINDIIQDSIVEVKASHILIKDHELAKEVLDKVNDGESFSDLAKEYSEDPGSKENGGDLGYFKRGVMVPPFENAAFSLAEGEVSELVESDFGYHIIKVEDKKTFDELKSELDDEGQIEAQRATIVNTIKEEKFAQKIEELKSEASIERFEDNID